MRPLTQLRLLLMAAATAVAACGGDASFNIAGGGTDGTGSPAQFSQGVMTKGSIILNGVRFDDSNTVVRTDDRTTTAAELASGMVVRLRGRLNADGVSGVAERVEVENEVRGAITSISAGAQPATMVVVGQTVIVDGNTLFANVSGIGALGIGQRVEVHGLRNAGGAIRATRVELVGTSLPDELKGVVSSLTSTTFSIGAITVNFAAVTLTPAGTVLANGQSVEVRGSFNAGTGVLNATSVTRDDLKDPLLRPGTGDKLEVEGFVTRLDTAASTFVVNGRTVRYSAATRFEDGTAADLVDNVEVEAEGTVDAAGILVATKIEFEQSRAILQGLATAVDTTQRRLTVLGQTVRIDDLTELRALDASGRETRLLADIRPGADRIRARARFDAGGALLAERVEEKDERDDELRGRVSAANEAARTLTIVGVNVALSNAVFRREGGTITAAAFFAAISPGSASNAGTVVKVKGSFAGGTFAAQEAQLDD